MSRHWSGKCGAVFPASSGATESVWAIKIQVSTNDPGARRLALIIPAARKVQRTRLTKPTKKSAYLLQGAANAQRLRTQLQTRRPKRYRNVTFSTGFSRLNLGSNLRGTTLSRLGMGHDERLQLGYHIDGCLNLGLHTRRRNTCSLPYVLRTRISGETPIWRKIGQHRTHGHRRYLRTASS